MKGNNRLQGKEIWATAMVFITVLVLLPHIVPEKSWARKGSLEIDRAAFSDEKNAAAPRKYAFLVSVDRFAEPGKVQLKELPDLSNDVLRLAPVLEKAGFSVETVTASGWTRPDGRHDKRVRPNGGWIKRRIETLGQDMYRNETLLVYFSGHGKGEFLCPYDYESKLKMSTGLKVAELTRMIRNAGAGQKFLFIDACHSGTATGSGKGTPDPGLDQDALRREVAEGFYILTSCRKLENSYVDKEEKISYFTKYLVLGLQGEADGYGTTANCHVELAELYNYVERMANEEVMREQGGQTQIAELMSTGNPLTRLAKVAGDCDPDPYRTEKVQWERFMAEAKKEVNGVLDAVRKEREAIRKERAVNRKEREANVRERLQLKDEIQATINQQQTLKDRMDSLRYRNRELDQREQAMLEKMKKQSEELAAKARDLARQQAALNDQSRQIDEREKRIAERSAQGRHKPAVAISNDLNGKIWTEKKITRMTFAWVPKGRFKGKRIDSFYIGRYEVTQGQWKSVMGPNPSYFKNCGDDCPVENVSWDDVQKFIEKLNLKTGKRFSLPTAAQWEYAATDGGKDIKYPWGNEDPDGSRANFCDKNCRYDWADKANDDGYKETAPVGSYPKGANELGLHDMAGNVWEWCQDWYDPKKKEYRVIRGGSWINFTWFCRSAFRYWLRPGSRNGYLGFRLVLLIGQ